MCLLRFQGADSGDQNPPSRPKKIVSTTTTASSRDRRNSSRPHSASDVGDVSAVIVDGATPATYVHYAPTQTPHINYSTAPLPYELTRLQTTPPRTPVLVTTTRTAAENNENHHSHRQQHQRRPSRPAVVYQYHTAPPSPRPASPTGATFGSGDYLDEYELAARAPAQRRPSTSSRHNAAVQAHRRSASYVSQHSPRASGVRYVDAAAPRRSASLRDQQRRWSGSPRASGASLRERVLVVDEGGRRSRRYYT